MHRFDGKTIKTTQNYKQTRSNYDQFASIDDQSIKTIKNVVFRRKTIKKQNYVWSNYNELDRFEVKRSKQLRGKIQTNAIKLRWIESTWHLNDQNFRVTSQNYKSHQITMNCIDLTSKLSKMFKTFNTTQNNKTDQITMYCIDLTSKQ